MKVLGLVKGFTLLEEMINQAQDIWKVIEKA
jgi:hypothetical protein